MSDTPLGLLRKIRSSVWKASTNHSGPTWQELCDRIDAVLAESGTQDKTADEIERLRSESQEVLQNSITGETVDGKYKSVNGMLAGIVRSEADDLRTEIEQLRKILAHVPGRIAIEAKEAAGFGDTIHAKESPDAKD